MRKQGSRSAPNPTPLKLLRTSLSVAGVLLSYGFPTQKIYSGSEAQLALDVMIRIYREDRALTSSTLGTEGSFLMSKTLGLGFRGLGFRV